MLEENMCNFVPNTVLTDIQALLCAGKLAGIVIIKFESRISTWTGLILGLRPANERCRYKVTSSLIGWPQT